MFEFQRPSGMRRPKTVPDLMSITRILIYLSLRCESLLPRDTDPKSQIGYLKGRFAISLANCVMAFTLIPILGSPRPPQEAFEIPPRRRLSRLMVFAPKIRPNSISSITWIRKKRPYRRYVVNNNRSALNFHKTSAIRSVSIIFLIRLHQTIASPPKP